MAEPLAVHKHQARCGLLPHRFERTANAETLNERGQESSKFGSVVTREPVDRPDESTPVIGGQRPPCGPARAVPLAPFLDRVEAGFDLAQDVVNQVLRLCAIVKLVLEHVEKGVAVARLERGGVHAEVVSGAATHNVRELNDAR